MNNNTTKCSICGAPMKVSLELCSGKPYRVQMCSEACMKEAFRIVTSAIRKGVRPQYPGDKSNKITRGRKLTEEERFQIVKMHIDGMKQADIARKIGRSPTIVSRVLKEEWNAKKW